MNHFNCFSRSKLHPAFSLNYTCFRLLLICLPVFILVNPSSANSRVEKDSVTSGIRIYNPFHIHIDPMERLLLVGIENDPDTLYLGFEPQVFSDSVMGEGHLIIAWRVDGRVDVYHEPGITPSAEKYDIAGKGLAYMVQTTMTEASFEIDHRGVQASYAFRDIYNREIRLWIEENNKSKRKPFGLLAPMGSAAENPSALPMVFLHDFYFVRRKNSRVEVSIEGCHHQPDKLPLPLDRKRMYFARYSPAPLIATLNPEVRDPLPYFYASGETVKQNGASFELQWQDNTPLISSITYDNDYFPLVLAFEPAFPCLQSLEEGEVHYGEFVVQGHPSTGSIKGVYHVEKIGNEIVLQKIPSGGWKPKSDKLSLRFLYSVAGIFKNWPATYQWDARIFADEQQQLQIISQWKRDLQP